VALKPNNLQVYNTLTRSKERFEPLDPPHVGMYVCGPTVYGDAHIGHAKSYVSFDVIVRYLRHLGYNVRYVQNITDVGHLTDDADQGEDKVERKARAEQVHPMQIAEKFTRSYFEDMDRLNLLRPDISPRASGHIIEQIELVRRLIAAGHAYEAGGNVYFDVASWPKYGKLSGRSVEEMVSGTRVETAADKRAPADFALWKRAEPGHIMQWPSPWGAGYPGWHLECSAMSMKYLGESFDIHGGGMENQFPHHEDEIAQAEAATGKPFVKYWLHNNMVTVGGQKMGKSLGNFITLKDAFKKWDPMVLRLFILQSHYRSPLDFSDEALGAAKEGYQRLVTAMKSLCRALGQGDLPSIDEAAYNRAKAEALTKLLEADASLSAGESLDSGLAQMINAAKAEALAKRPQTDARLSAGESLDSGLAQMINAVKTAILAGAPMTGGPDLKVTELVSDARRRFSTAMDDDFNTAGAIALLFDLAREANRVVAAGSATRGTLETFATAMRELAGDVLGLSLESAGAGATEGVTSALVQSMIDLRKEARAAKNFALADSIRKRLDEIGIVLEDTPEGTQWRFR